MRSVLLAIALISAISCTIMPQKVFGQAADDKYGIYSLISGGVNIDTMRRYGYVAETISSIEAKLIQKGWTYDTVFNSPYGNRIITYDYLYRTQDGAGTTSFVLLIESELDNKESVRKITFGSMLSDYQALYAWRLSELNFTSNIQHETNRMVNEYKKERESFALYITKATATAPAMFFAEYLPFSH